MALWTENRRFMWIGRSGYDYNATICSDADIDAAVCVITGFYTSCGATVRETSREKVGFTRGKKVARWLHAAETRHPQSIEIALRCNGRTTVASIHYHVDVSFALKFAPCMLVREIAELRKLLEVGHVG